MAFWSKSEKKQEDISKHADLGRNDPCHCGSGKKYKKCCLAKDETAERKVLDAKWEKSTAEAKAEAEKAEKAAKEAPPTAPAKHTGPQKSTKQAHPTFVPTQVNLPRKSGGG